MNVRKWETFVLGDLCQITSSKRIFAEEYVDVGIPFYRSKEVIEKALGEDITLDLFIPKERFDEIKKSFGAPQKGDILISSVGNRSGIPYLVKDDDGDFYFKDGNVIWFKDFNKKLNSKYLSYWLKSSLGQSAFDSIMIGSAQKALTIMGISGLSITLPNISVQEYVADILSSLDDKIELNRRMNATLESIAQAMFREMMKNEDGRWNAGSILEFADLLSGGTPSTSEASYWNGNIEWVSAKDVGNVNGVFLLNTEKKITQQGVDNSSTKLLPAKTTVVTARGTVGAHCMLGKSMAMNQTNYGLKAKDGISDYFVYFTLSEMVEQLKQQSYGTIFDTITTKIFQSVQCVQPPLDVIQKFEGQVTPLMNAILNNQKQSRTLASLRDSLLLKLMRGEVRVK